MPQNRRVGRSILFCPPPGRERWGDEGYAREELVAELGSAFPYADLELALEPREDHAAYIESWLKVLQNDKRAIFSAAAHAQRAADYLNSLQSQAHKEAAAQASIPADFCVRMPSRSSGRLFF